MKYVWIALAFFVSAIILDVTVQIVKEMKKHEKVEVVKSETKEESVVLETTPPAVVKNTQSLDNISPQINADALLGACDMNLSIDECIEQMGAKAGDNIFIRIFKLTAELEVWIKVDDYYQLLKVYPICKQSGKLGPKLKEGDRQGPEGFYSVNRDALNPNSKYHLSFNLGFPNAYDEIHGWTGSALMVHGGCVSVGCFAMTDAKIDEIYGLVDAAIDGGQQEIPVHVFPFRMTDEMMLKYSDNEWYNFWGNLKEGYDYFEESRMPPNTAVINRRYVFK